MSDNPKILARPPGGLITRPYGDLNRKVKATLAGGVPTATIIGGLLGIAARHFLGVDLPEEVTTAAGGYVFEVAGAAVGAVSGLIASGFGYFFRERA